MKVALACSGAGRVQRGFERLFQDLFEHVRGDLDVTFFKGGGEPADGERVAWNMPRQGALCRLLPLHALLRRSPYYQECWTFALSLWPRLIAGRYDVVHYIDLPLGQALHALRRASGSRLRLLHTQGSSLDPRWYPPADHIHQISQAQLQDALDHGVPAGRMTLIPCGVRLARLRVTATRAELRRRHGIPEDRFVVLTVCAIDRVQKRLDYVIDELASLRDGSLLWADGHIEDQGLPAYGARALGERFRVTRVPSDQVGELYALADVFVLGSLQESFGMAVAEAMCAGLPVVTHDSPHFRWLVGPGLHAADLSRPGSLAGAVASLRDQPALRARLGALNAASATSRFDWEALRGRYLELYRVAAGPTRS